MFFLFCFFVLFTNWLQANSQAKFQHLTLVLITDWSFQRNWDAIGSSVHSSRNVRCGQTQSLQFHQRCSLLDTAVHRVLTEMLEPMCYTWRYWLQMAAVFLLYKCMTMITFGSRHNWLFKDPIVIPIGVIPSHKYWNSILPQAYTGGGPLV